MDSRPLAVDTGPQTCGLLISGGLDSSILLGHLLATGRRVQPFHVRTDVVWRAAELAATERFLAAIRRPALAKLVIFEMPLSDLYTHHWSMTGTNTPDQDSPDEAVFLPGRNALLAIKPLLWCQAHGIPTLAIGTLQGNPFADAQPDYLQRFTSALFSPGEPRVSIVQPLSALAKPQVLALGRALPLEHTFSCIAPVDENHCGACNKCAERRRAFLALNRPDPTHYAHKAAAERAPPPPNTADPRRSSAGLPAKLRKL